MVRQPLIVPRQAREVAREQTWTIKALTGFDHASPAQPC
jgi:hypothetical protein